MTVRALQDLVVVEDDAAGVRIEADDLARDENFGAQALGLPKRPARELRARDSARKSEIVLDSRRRLRLASRRLLLDHDRAQALRGAVHGRGEARRPSADDDRVIFLKARSGLKAEPSRELAGMRPNQFRPVGEPEDRAIALCGRVPGQLSARLGSSASSQLKEIWLRSRKRRRSRQAPPQRFPKRMT